MPNGFLPFALDFRDEVTVVVVSEGSRQLLVVHRRFVFPLTPQASAQLWIVQLEFPRIAAPFDDRRVLSVGENLKKELPQLNLTVVTISVV